MDLMEFCYGPDTTIYEVLGVHENAQPKDIQSAFTERRMELYKSLQALNQDSEFQVVDVKTKDGKGVQLSEKTLIEKQMDALVAGFRILRDPKKRRRYDTKLNKARTKKISKRARSTSTPQPKLKQNNQRHSPNSAFDFDEPAPLQEKDDWLPEELRDTDVGSNDEGKKRIVKLKDEPRYLASKSSSSRNGSAESGSTATTTKSAKSGVSKPDRNEEDIEQYYKDVVSQRETGLGSWLRSKNYNDQANAVDNASSEVAGSVADLWLSFSQVFSAFTIDDDALDAIGGDINEASRDLQSGKYA